jgi:hypothetical protein
MKTTRLADADPRFALAWGIGCFGIAGLSVWEFFRTTDPGLRTVMPVLAIAMLVSGVTVIRRRHDIRSPRSTRHPRLMVVLSVFPTGLAVAGVWAYQRWGDVFDLICAPLLLAMGIWGVAVGVKALKQT